MATSKSDTIVDVSPTTPDTPKKVSLTKSIQRAQRNSIGNKSIGSTASGIGPLSNTEDSEAELSPENSNTNTKRRNFQRGWKYVWAIAVFLLDHPTWRMGKRQATVLTSCLCQLANILPIFMSKSKKYGVYTKIYNLYPAEVALEVWMYLMDLTLLFPGYTGRAWWALPWLSFAPFYWLYQMYSLFAYAASPPSSIYQQIRLYDILTRAILYPYLYVVIYSTFGYLLTKETVGFDYNPQDEHVPVITPEVIQQMEDIAARQGMSAPEALLYIYKRTGTNWGVTSTALQFDPNASLPKYRGR